MYEVNYDLQEQWLLECIEHRHLRLLVWTLMTEKIKDNVID